MNTPRGIRNLNPGNIRKSAGWQKWQGLADAQTDPEFVQFKTACFGIRALARTLITYQDKRRADDGSTIDTISDVIHRWAPPSENDTQSYVDGVALSMGMDDIEVIDLHNYDHLRPLVEAIIHHENGQMPYSRAQIDNGLKMAGVVPEPRRGVMAEATNPKSATAAITATAATIGATVAPIASVWDQLATIIDPRILMWGVSLTLGIVAAYLIIDRIRERRDGRA